MTLHKFVTDDQVIIYRIDGKMISSTIDNLKASLDAALEGEGRGIVINCSKAVIIDATSLGLLISRARAATKKGWRFCFCEPQPATRKLLEIMDTDHKLNIYNTENEAISFISAKEIIG